MKRVYIVTDTNMDHICTNVRTANIGDVVQISDPTRNLEQNALLWPLLETISKNVVWYGQKLNTFEWKDVFTSSLKKSKIVPGIEQGSLVVCGMSTSKMGKKDFSELIELIYAFGVEHGIDWALKQGAKQ